MKYNILKVKEDKIKIQDVINNSNINNEFNISIYESIYNDNDKNNNNISKKQITNNPNINKK